MIRIDGVVLRPLEPADLEQLYRYRNDPEVTKYLEGFSTGYSRQGLADWLEGHRRRSDQILWAIALEEDDRCIGHVGLYQIDFRVGKAEFGILIGDKSHQGRGFGRRVTCEVIDYGFRELRLNKITLTVLESNERAIHLYESLGFRTDGTLREEQFRDGQYVDVRVMSLLAREWKK